MLFKIFFCSLFLLFILQQSSAVVQDSLKKYSAVRVDVAPKIDGSLDDIAWAQANVITDFVMNRPNEGGQPTLKTEVKIVYDNFAIYVGAMLYDSAPDSILHELGLRDGFDPATGNFNDLNADYFRFVIDPYNTRQDAFDFGVYASGVQADGKFSDYLFDAVWESSAKITDKGWIVEMKIPYSAIRFPAKPVQEWALQCTRTIRRKREFLQWNLTPSTAYNSQDYWGTLSGIENIKPPLRLSLTPYISTAYEQTPQPGMREINRSFSYRGGADLKYGLDERFTLDMTLLPDFGQVQSDNKIKTLSYEEINYDENRSFFKEGTDIFAKDNLFYSRRIGQTPSGYYAVYENLNENEEIKENPMSSRLLNATKISGRTNQGIGLGLFNAVTNNTYATIQDNQTGLTRKVLTDPLTNYNVAVIDKQWKNNSSVYLINTNVSRSKKFNDANVTGIGFTIINKKNTYGTDGSFDVSQQIFKPHDEISSFNQTGIRYSIGIRKTSGTIRWGLSRNGVNNTYDPTDLGYYTTSNREYTNGYLNFYRFKPYWKIQEGNTRFSFTYKDHFSTGNLMNLEVRNNSFILFKSYNALFGGAGFNPLTGRDYDPRLNGRYSKSLRYWYGYLGTSTDYRKAVALDMTLNISNFIDQFKSEGFNIDATLRYRANDKLTLSLTSSYYWDPYNFGYVSPLDENVYLFGGRKTNTYVNQLTIRYIFKNDLSLSINARHYWFNVKYRSYFLLEDDGNYSRINDTYNGAYDFSYNYFNADILFSWRFAPGSNISVSYKNIFDAGTDLTTLSFRKNLHDVFDNPHAQTFSIKVLYFLDYLQLKKKN
jgi:hypothetical protein